MYLVRCLDLKKNQDKTLSRPTPRASVSVVSNQLDYDKYTRKGLAKNGSKKGVFTDR